MRIDGAIQAPNANQTQTEQKPIPVIDENRIRDILFLGVRGNIKIQPDVNRSVDMYA
jgi:hypothetical protein